MKRFLLITSLLQVSVISLHAQIAAWDFNTLLGSEVSVAATTLDPNLQSTSVTRGAGLTSSALANAFSSTDFALNGTFTDALNNNDYKQFTIQATSGYQVSLSTLDANFRRSSTGPNTFQWQYSLDGFTTPGVNIGSAITFTSTLTGGVAQTQIDLTGIAALQNVGSGTSITIRLYGYGATAVSGTFALGRLIGNDLAIGGTVSSESLNTITTGTVSSPPFILADCSDTETGTVDFTSTGTFNGGNVYTAQLSDNTGSFATPLSIGTLSSMANAGTINITIPAGTPGGAAYKIRVVSSDPVTTGSESAAFTITQLGVGGCASSSTDYYRSFQTGDWDDISTWESSPDNTNWIPATLTPTSSANTITIRNGHTVTVVASVTVDQVEVLSGGTLENNVPASNVLTVANGPTAIDLDIKSGAVYLVTSSENYTNSFSISSGAVMNIESNGTIQVGVGGTVGGGNNAYGITATSFVWNDGSIFRWNSTTTPGIQATFFPDATASVIPILRFTASPAFSMGGATATVINGRLEATAAIEFTGASTKTFRNGIVNSAEIDGASGTSLKFIINGSTAQLGGGGDIFLPATGLEVGSSTTVTMTSDKTLTGNLSLLTLTNIDLGIFNLTVTGTVSNATVTAYVRTNSTGALAINNISTGAGGKLFPIGRSTINPLFIQSNVTTNYSARVVEPITPAIVYPAYAVSRTWNISSATAAPGAIISFGYSYPGDCGASYTNAFPVEIAVNVSGTWNIHQTGLTPAAFPIVPGTFAVTNTVPVTTFTAGTEFPFVVGNSGAALPLDYFIVARAHKQNNNGIISWTIHDADVVRNFEVQRSENGTYTTIATINAVTGQVNYSFTDAGLQDGTNLYRVKVNRISGDSRYSNTVTIINGNRGLMITSILPNPVQGSAVIDISVAKKGVISFEIYNIAGQPVRKWIAVVMEGSNSITANLDGIPSGIYHVLAQNADSRTVFRFVEQ